MKFRGRWIVGGVAFFLVVIVVLPLATMLLWNALVPSLFKGPSVGFAQALGLLVLSHILLRGGRPWHCGYGWRHERWRKRFEEKLQSMSPDERERFREGWGRRWGCGPDASVGPDPAGPKSASK